jgi:hypothetical protein
MDDFDLAMLSFALLDAFPGIKIFDAFGKLPTPDLRNLEVAQLFGKDNNLHRFLFFCLPEPRWSPVCLPELPAGIFHFLANPPRLIIECRCGAWYWGTTRDDEPKWIFGLPSPGCGEIAIKYRRDDEKDRAFVREVWRILNRLTTNRFQGGMPHLGIVEPYRKPWPLWAGHHVVEWCQQVYDRMIDGVARPVDGWTAPDTPWHRELRARVISQFGHTLDEPKEPAPRNGPFAVFAGPFTFGTPKSETR